MSRNYDCSACGQDLRLPIDVAKSYRKLLQALKDIRNAKLAKAERLRQIAAKVIEQDESTF